MATKNYPPISAFPIAAVQSAPFNAQPGNEYPVDTSAAGFIITPGGTGAGATLGATTVNGTGGVTAIAPPIAGAEGLNYTQYSPIVLGNADPGTGFVGYATVDALGKITGVNIISPGSGYTAGAQFVALPGPKVDDRFVISDVKGTFQTNPPTIRTGHWKLWGTQGDDLKLVEAGMSACLVFTSANGWMMSAGS